jgi:hypothetical protein
VPEAGRAVPPLLRGLVRARRRVVAVGSGVRAERRWADLLRDQTGEVRRKTLLDLVLAQVADVLGLDADQPVAVDRGFYELGLDSLMALDLSRRLGSRTGTALTPAGVFGNPTPEALAEHLLDRLDSDA